VSPSFGTAPQQRCIDQEACRLGPFAPGFGTVAIFWLLVWQVMIANLALGFYVIAKDVRLSRPLRRGATPATRPEQAPISR